MIEVGINVFRWLWKINNHSYPFPDFKAAESCQFTSHPSKLLSNTNVANLLAQSKGLRPIDVGIYLGPKALTRICDLPLLYLCLRLACISYFVFPKIESSPKQSTGLAHTLAAYVGRSPHFQKPNIMQLYIFQSEKPGTPKLDANLSTGQNYPTLSTYPTLIG